MVSSPGVGVSWRSLRSCPLLDPECRSVPPREPGPKVPAGGDGRAIGDLRPLAAGAGSGKVAS